MVLEIAPVALISNKNVYTRAFDKAKDKKKRKCSNEEDPKNSTDTSSLIPNSQECVDISMYYMGKDKEKKILMNGKYIISVLDNLY